MVLGHFMWSLKLPAMILRSLGIGVSSLLWVEDVVDLVMCYAGVGAQNCGGVSVKLPVSNTRNRHFHYEFMLRF